VRTFVYDVLGRLQSIDDTGGGIQEPRTTRWFYDEHDNLGRLTRTLSAGTPEYENGQQVEYSYEPSSGIPSPGALRQVVTTLDGNPYVTTMTYDAFGRVSSMEYPSRTSADPIKAEYEYDASGVLMALKERDGATLRTLWHLDEAFHGFVPKQETFGNGAVTTYTFDNRWQLPESVTTMLESTAIQYQVYEYYGNRQLASKYDVGELTPRGTHHYSYDLVGRLEEDLHVGGDAVAYAYDASGNLTLRGDKGNNSQIIEYGNPLRPHEVTRALWNDQTQDFRNSYAYDAKGRVQSRSGSDVPGGHQSFQYTRSNLPSAVHTGELPSEMVTTRFEYDADGNRVIERDPDFTRHIASGLYEAKESLEGDLEEERFKISIEGRIIGEIKRNAAGEEIYYYHRDQLNSVDTISTTNAGTVTRQDFEAFGASGPGLSIRSGFAGHEHDRDLGLINMKGRSYDPLTGRFMSQDPLMPAPYWSQGLNRYSYGFCDPINNTDPTGFLSWEEGVGIGLMVVAYAVIGYGIADEAGLFGASAGFGGGEGIPIEAVSAVQNVSTATVWTDIPAKLQDPEVPWEWGPSQDPASLFEPPPPRPRWDY
jgi:RHS repeat-associated protein